MENVKGVLSKAKAIATVSLIVASTFITIMLPLTGMMAVSSGHAGSTDGFSSGDASPESSDGNDPEYQGNSTVMLEYPSTYSFTGNSTENLTSDWTILGDEVEVVANFTDLFKWNHADVVMVNQSDSGTVSLSKGLNFPGMVVPLSEDLEDEDVGVYPNSWNENWSYTENITNDYYIMTSDISGLDASGTGGQLHDWDASYETCMSKSVNATNRGKLGIDFYPSIPESGSELKVVQIKALDSSSDTIWKISIEMNKPSEGERKWQFGWHDGTDPRNETSYSRDNNDWFNLRHPPTVACAPQPPPARSPPRAARPPSRTTRPACAAPPPGRPPRR